MKTNKIFGLIGLAARARRVAFGADSVELEIKKNKVHILLIAEDASDRTKEKFKKLANDNNIEIITYGLIDEISKAIGKSNKAIIGILDKNISNEIKKINNGGDLLE